ncbi:4Fe-4S binding protein [Methanomassiliicoccus luminyensis]|jgi:formate hydrogenlyase subunit 6/NADH:ubiquinone oxidoreductase subunit I|uniref:4Fe-4S binding protein n=1 Tax=Methanomassiliicoccus luminyensis TaxID=1080712 RepID=UPI00035FDBAA|nr:4Fe-4S binding protein [Methanomassiliicoccus luminyensis]
MSMMSIVIKNLFSRPDTVPYPAAPADLPDSNRGGVRWDMSKCSLCGLCAKRCPTLAVAVDKKAATIELQVFRCIACGVCVDICPQDAIEMVPEYSRPGPAKDVRKYRKEPTSADRPTDR